MDIKEWGSSGWRFLHPITFAFDPKKKQKYKTFFETLPDVLPCRTCGEHFRQNLNKHLLEPALTNKESLSRWLVTMHNEVNSQRRKPILDYETVRRHYEDGTNELGSALNMTAEQQLARAKTLNVSLIVACAILFVVIVGLCWARKK